MKSKTNLNFWRADFYRLLALGFDFPSHVVAETMETLARDLSASSFGDRKLKELLGAFSKEIANDWSGREALYHHLFTTQVACSPCEGSYHLTERGAVIGDISAFYSAFHLKLVERQGPPDAIKMELGFMSYLCLKKASAIQNRRDEDLAVTSEAETLFLKKHLGRWALLFASRLLEETESGYYPLLSRLLSLWIEKECRLTGAKPSPFSIPLPAFEDEEVACAMAH